MGKNMSLYELTNTGNLLQAMFVEGEIDEQTLEDSRELIISELENKSTSLIMLWQEFFKFIGNGTSNKGLAFEEEKRLKELRDNYTKKFEKYKEKISECMLSLGMETGKANGVMTPLGVLTLTKNTSKIYPKVEEVESKYLNYRIKELILTQEEFNDKNIPEWLKVRLEDNLKAIELNKTLYSQDNEDLPRPLSGQVDLVNRDLSSV